MRRWTGTAARHYRDALPPEQAHMIRQDRRAGLRSFCYAGTALALLLALLHWQGVGL